MLPPSRGGTPEPLLAHEGATRSRIREIADAWAHRTRCGATTQTWGTGGDILGAPAKLVPRAGVVLATRRAVCASVNNPIGQQVHSLGSAGAPLSPRVPVDKNPCPFSAADLERLHARTAGHRHGLAERRRAAGSRRPSDAGPSASGAWGKGRTESPAPALKGVPSRGTLAEAGRRTQDPPAGMPSPRLLHPKGRHRTQLAEHQPLHGRLPLLREPRTAPSITCTDPIPRAKQTRRA
ncbi:uncharacterized protein [Callorhinus ursinus]|uniref:uncharacterized protein n=1 Tax=Callorhinus ursinus TaxID=34884 RepID=UPI003CCFFA0C